jgi:DNA-nicking Smr family endonuclease
MSQEDMELFQQMMDGVKQLQHDTTNIQHRSKVSDAQLAKRAAAVAMTEQDPEYLSLDNAPMLNPNAHFEYKRNGIQDGVYRKLRLGKYPIQAKLDLHKKNLEQARDEIVRFIKRCIRLDIRTVIIVHGKGERANPPALMKSYVSHWVTQIEDVQCAHTAQQFHGGSGALYLLLRKSPDKKAENRERHQKRSI